MEGEFELATVDIVIVAAYVVLILGVGFWAGRGKSDIDSYFLGGRQHLWPLVGFGLMAVNFSGTQYIGLAGAGYEEGIAVWNYEWMAALVLVFFALFIIPFYLQSKISTVPEFLEKRYDRRSRYAFSGFTVGTAMFIDSAGAMFAGAITLQLLFPDQPLWLHVVFIALLGGVYVILGGLQAVMITDTVQGILLFVAGGIIFVVAFAQFDFDWSTLVDLAPEDGWTIAPPAAAVTTAAAWEKLLSPDLRVGFLSHADDLAAHVGEQAAVHHHTDRLAGVGTVEALQPGAIGEVLLDPHLVAGVEAQIHRVFDNLGAVAAAAGGSLDDVVKLTVYLTDLGNFARVNEMMDRFEAELARRPERTGLARSAAEVRALHAAGRIAFVHAVEGAHVLEGRLEHLDALAARGVAALTLAHFFDNGVAEQVDGIPRDLFVRRWCGLEADWRHPTPLTDFGRAVVRRAGELGVLVDVTHCTPPARAAVFAEAGRRPLVATHVGVRARNPDPYNLADDEIRAFRDDAAALGVETPEETPRATDEAKNFGRYVLAHAYTPEAITRAVDNGAWMQFARSLIEAGTEAAAAAQAHDVERVFAAGERVYNACAGCHARYVPQ